MLQEMKTIEKKIDDMMQMEVEEKTSKGKHCRNLIGYWKITVVSPGGSTKETYSL